MSSVKEHVRAHGLEYLAVFVLIVGIVIWFVKDAIERRMPKALKGATPSVKEHFRAHAREYLAVLVAFILIIGIVIWFVKDTKDMADAEHAAKVIAILIGGLWVVFRFVIRQAFESTLRIKVRVRSVPLSQQDAYRVFVEIELANTGGRRIYAARSLSQAELDKYEGSIDYPCDLELRSVTDPAVTNHASKRLVYEDWWGNPQRRHVSVLSEYSLAGGSIDFFMEPGEKYFLGHLFTMPSGQYMAKVVFVGARAGAAEYWSRITFFCVPQGDPGARKDEQSGSGKI